VVELLEIIAPLRKDLVLMVVLVVELGLEILVDLEQFLEEQVMYLQ
jgi:hypothetical protein